jgi:hypothetical protein
MPKDVSTGERRILGTLLDNPNMLCPWLPQDVGIALGYPEKIPGISRGYPRGDLSQDLGIRWGSRRVNPKMLGLRFFNIFIFSAR